MSFDPLDALLWLIWAYGCGVVFGSAAVWRIDCYLHRKPMMPVIFRKKPL